MKLLGKKILLRQHRTKDKTEGGIQLPQAAIQKLPYGTVVQVGPDIEETVRVAIEEQVVLFNQLGAVLIQAPNNGEELVMIEPEDILAILEKEEY